MLNSVSSIISNLLSRLTRRSRFTGPAHLQSGQWGEEMAERHLKKSGYRILGRRVVPCGRDELDLIARSPNDVLIFVEVKTRADESFGRPFSSIDHRKRKALSRAAWRYLSRLKPKPNYFRFDVVEVIGKPECGVQEIRHIENAFPLEGKKRIPW
jgi:putative endonuclease